VGAIMKTEHKSSASDFIHIAFIDATVQANPKQSVFNYLISVADAAVAIGMLISICGVSLLVLYTALGVL
jgi:hypothetical protein